MENHPLRPPVSDTLKFAHPNTYHTWCVKVAQFHRDRLKNTLPTTPDLIEDGRMEHNVECIREEATEIEDAIRDHDLPGIADGIIDLLYYTIGMGLRLGLPLDALFTEVHYANMDKEHNPLAHHTRAKRVIKPEGWREPRVAEMLKAAGWVDDRN